MRKRNPEPKSPKPSSRLRKLQNKLYEAYGRPKPDAIKDGLDALSELIATVLSQHTSDKNSQRAFMQLRSRYKTWQDVQRAPVTQLANTIKSGGLAKIKAQRIQTILNTLDERYGKLDLEFLSKYSIPKAREVLESLPGVGPKTASCVLLFSLGKPVMPVDTHVHRICQRLGLLGNKVNAEQAQEILEGLIEPKDRYGFHITLIRHGREVCKSFQPRCKTCVVLQYCPYGENVLKYE